MTREGFTTRAVRSARRSVGQRPVSPPLYQSATFAFDDMDDFAEVAQRKTHGGYLYSRWANPTVDGFGETIADLEGAEATACFSSGMAALYGALTVSLVAGDHVVCAEQVYGGTRGVLGTAMKRMDVSASFVDVTDHAAIDAAFTDRSRVLLFETIGNPTLPVADVEALAEIAHARGATVIVDGTFTPPCALRPLELGADLVVHSITKYIGGHSDVTGGVVSGSSDRIEAVRHLQIDTGAILAPFEAWLAHRGVQTLALRWDRICDSAVTLARWLGGHAGVERVHYPGLASHPQHDLAKRLLGERAGGMLAFEVAGGYEAGRRLLERVSVCSPAASLGGTKSLVVHPASVTHTQLSPDERAAAGISDGLIRMAVGIEDAPDLIADLERALG